jgi:hypothetical protein
MHKFCMHHMLVRNRLRSVLGHGASRSAATWGFYIEIKVIKTTRMDKFFG